MKAKSSALTGTPSLQSASARSVNLYERPSSETREALGEIGLEGELVSDRDEAAEQVGGDPERESYCL